MQRFEGAFWRHIIFGAVFGITILANRSDVIAQETSAIVTNSFELSIDAVTPDRFDTSFETNGLDVPALDTADKNDLPPQQNDRTDTTDDNEQQPQSQEPRDEVVVEIPPSETIPPVEIPIEPPFSGLEQALRGFTEEQREAVFQNLAQLGQTLVTVGLLASSINQNIIAGALDADLEPDSGGQSPFVVTTAGSSTSLFMVSGYKKRSHDGFSIESSLDYADGKGPGFDEDNYGLTIGTRFDGSTVFGTTPGTVTLGLIGNYTHTDIEVDAPAEFAGLGNGGSADVDSWSVGGYGLVTDGKKYGILTVTGTFGSPETSSAVIPSAAEFDTYGVAASALVGTLIPVSTTTKFDLRGGVNLVHAQSDDYRDSLGTAFTDGELNEVSGTMSLRLFTVVQTSDYNMRPFVQGGLTHRFHYENELTIDGEEFSFDDADTTVFARAGVDFSIDRSTQAYLAVRGDASEDVESIAAQVGVTFKTN